MSRWFAFAAVLLAGCRGESPSAVDTGAKETAIAWFGGLSSGDAKALEVLDADSRQKMTAEQFDRLSKAYRKKVGYPVDRVHVQTCEENGDSATAHVVLIGRSGGHSRCFEDAVALCRRDGKWGVVLSASR